MPGTPSPDLDFLAARLHGRRSRLADRERLADLCGLETLEDLSRARWPRQEPATAAGFQRQLIEELIGELSEAAGWLEQSGRALLHWILGRFQVENLKVILRSIHHQIPPELAQPHVVQVPGFPLPDPQAVRGIDRLERVVAWALKHEPRKGARLPRLGGADPRTVFVWEAALDGDYLVELLTRAARLSNPDRDLVIRLVEQELNTHQLMLVARGRFNYHLSAEELLPLQVPAAGISRARFKAMLAAPDPRALATLALGRAFDSLPAEAPVDTYLSALESLAAQRTLRLANRAFRQSHMGVGAVIGYATLRRIEVANLISLSEGLHLGAAPEQVGRRLVPPVELEGRHV